MRPSRLLAVRFLKNSPKTNKFSAPLSLLTNGAFAHLFSPLSAYAAAPVVVAVSGGADSVGLLHACVGVGMRVTVAHLDHALRPESAQDACWVADLCAELDVPFYVERVPVDEIAARRGWNLEDAARRIRYQFLSRVAKKTGATAILTAHTRRDQAETVLTSLLRGEPRLSGMTARIGQRGGVQRPWLGCSRESIEAFLQAYGTPIQGNLWREDATNHDPHFQRAWLRLQVMPLLGARYPALEETLCRVGALQAEDEEVLAAAARFREHTPLAGQPRALLRRYVVNRLAAAGLRYHAGHVSMVATALQTGITTHLTLEGGQEITVTGGQLFLKPRVYQPPTFSYPSSWKLRHKQNGDRIRLAGGRRKVSDVLIDKRVPKNERDRFFLLEDGEGEVQWLGLDPPVWAHDFPFPDIKVKAQDPDEVAMRLALDHAKKAAENAEVPVGAVILDETGAVIAKASNASRAASDMTQHAELRAIHEACAARGAYLVGCTLVVTLEPCMMCLGAALEARISRIVYGASNPKSGALGGLADLLHHHWGHVPEVRGGVMAREARHLLRHTFSQLRPSACDL